MSSGPVESPPAPQQTTPLKIAAIYALVGCLWILLSDELVSILFSDQATITRVSMYKGWMYVVVTALLIYVLVSRALDKARQAQEALRQSEARYRLISENTGDVIWLLDAATRRFLYVSPSVERLRGFTPEEAMAQSLEEALTPESYRRVSAALPQKLAGFLAGDESQVVQTHEVDQPRKDGSIVATEVVTTLLKNQQGQAAEILGVSRDITEGKKARESLRESQELLALVADSLPAFIAFIDSEQRYRFINHRLSEMLGLPPEQVIGRTLREVMPPELFDKISPQVDVALEGRAVSFEIQSPLQIVSGREFLVRYVPHLGGQGQMAGFFVLGQDITELKQAAREKAQLEAQLRQTQKMEAIGTLAGGIAHDFNNILGAIMGYAEMAVAQLPSGHPAHREMQEVVQASQRAADLVRQILTFSRRSEGEPQPLSLALVVKEAVRLLRASLPASIDIRTDITSEGTTVLADPTQMHQVLMNLCSNAGYAMRERGGVLTVRLQDVGPGDPDLPPELGPGDYLRLSVIDTGAGIDPQVQERIFEPYFTTKGPGEGTGMGLSLVQGIVRACGGVIRVRSQPGQGTEFHVYFARAQPREDSPQASIAPPLRGSERILMVDDEPALVDVGRAWLENLGYQVKTCTNSLEALDLFRNQPQDFDLIITDQTMPVLSGLELTRRALAIRPDIPIILCSGYSDQVTPELALEQGVREYLHKPVMGRQLAASIRQALDQRGVAAGQGAEGLASGRP